ncbi:sugar ABC transporter permease [Oscillospiraceae bacterium HV4-5-C5C]|nr:sugar ABC transporter permease [Oscillospiraceae bacterium HV4-5-C5C]
MKKHRATIILFILPCVLSLFVMYLYPVVRTVIMSFFSIESVTAPARSWTFNGLANYISLFTSSAFLTALWNMVRIWLLGGVVTLALALLFAVILCSGVRFKKFFRAAIYLPNIISAVALATMWIQYVFNYDFGLLNGILKEFGVSNVKWLGTDMKFWSMLIAYIFGATGYFMLIFISGIERIPADLYEASTIDGAGKVRQFFSITMPLLKGITKTNITFWTITTTSFFLWSKMFSPVSSENSTLVPVIYIYDRVFGTASNTTRNAGLGAAAGVFLSVVVLLVYILLEKVIKNDDLEF